jgi:hypothetical protein
LWLILSRAGSLRIVPRGGLNATGVVKPSGVRTSCLGSRFRSPQRSTNPQQIYRIPNKTVLQYGLKAEEWRAEQYSTNS